MTTKERNVLLEYADRFESLDYQMQEKLPAWLIKTVIHLIPADYDFGEPLTLEKKLCYMNWATLARSVAYEWTDGPDGE